MGSADSLYFSVLVRHVQLVFSTLCHRFHLQMFLLADAGRRLSVEGGMPSPDYGVRA